MPDKPIHIVRIDMTTAEDLDKAIVDTCTNCHNAGYRLAASFAMTKDLVLIFEKP